MLDLNLPPDPHAIKEKLSELKVLRYTVKEIDPANTAIITLYSVLPSSIRYYTEKYSDHLPVFILADKEDMAECAKLSQDLNIKIFPVTERHRLAQKQYCLYATPKWNIWDKDALETLASQCEKAGITGGYQVDAATMAPLPKRKPSPEHIERRLNDISYIYSSLADSESKDVFLRFIKSLMTGNVDYLPFSPYPQYRHPAALPKQGDLIVDGGAFDGASALSFSDLAGEEGCVIAFEPLGSSSELAQKTIAKRDNIRLEPYALWSKSANFHIKDCGSGSTLTQDAEGEHVKAISLDEYFAFHPSRCDCIKLDIEGAEMEALEGAMRTITVQKPKLHICLYHKQAHYLDIPLFILKNWPFYNIYMGHHSHSVWESCLYAVPKSSV